jgi:hypothetical protein
MRKCKILRYCGCGIKIIGVIQRFQVGDEEAGGRGGTILVQSDD